MNREIKFRAWASCDEGLKMVYFDTMDCDNGLWFGSFEHIDEYKDNIMQFTGLKDKNGKEIYEGDIVKVKGTKRVGEYVTEIIWQDCGFKLKENKTYLKDGKILPNMLEVIGNIYETPELLTPSL